MLSLFWICTLTQEPRVGFFFFFLDKPDENPLCSYFVLHQSLFNYLSQKVHLFLDPDVFIFLQCISVCKSLVSSPQHKSNMAQAMNARIKSALLSFWPILKITFLKLHLCLWDANAKTILFMSDLNCKCTQRTSPVCSFQDWIGTWTWWCWCWSKGPAMTHLSPRDQRVIEMHWNSPIPCGLVV